jgi:hypothetical protein
MIRSTLLTLTLSLGLAVQALADDRVCPDFECIPTMVALFIANTPQGVSSIVPKDLHSNPDFALELGERIRTHMRSVANGDAPTRSQSALSEEIAQELSHRWGRSVSGEPRSATEQLKLLVERTLFAIYETTHRWGGSEIPRVLYEKADSPFTTRLCNPDTAATLATDCKDYCSKCGPLQKGSTGQRASLAGASSCWLSVSPKRVHGTILPSCFNPFALLVDDQFKGPVACQAELASCIVSVVGDNKTPGRGGNIR